MRRNIASWRVRGGIRHSGNSQTREQSARFLGWNRVVEKASENAQLRAKVVIDAHILFPVVEDIAPHPGQSVIRRVGERRKFCIDIVDISLRRRIDVGDLRGLAGAVAVLIKSDAGSCRQGALQHRGRRQFAAGEGVVVDDSSPLLRVKEECLVAILIVDAGNEQRAAQGEAEVVPAQFGAVDSVTIVEEVIGVEHVIAEEVVRAAVELAGAAARDDRDLARRTDHVQVGHSSAAR